MLQIRVFEVLSISFALNAPCLVCPCYLGELVFFRFVENLPMLGKNALFDRICKYFPHLSFILRHFCDMFYLCKNFFFFLPILIFDYLSLQTDTHTCIHTQALSYLFLVVLSRIYLIWARYLSLVFPRWLPNYLNTFQSHFPAGSTCHLHLSLKSQVYVFGFLSTLHSLIYVFMQQDHNILIAEDFYDL